MDPLPALSPFTFGSMSLGSYEGRFEADIRLARRAMEAGVWFHTSPTYHRGFSFLVLRMAFDADRARVPKLIVKIRDARPWLLRFEVEDALRRLGVEQIAVAQLVQQHPGAIVEDFLSGGPLRAECEALKAEGKVGAFCLYCDRARSEATLRAVDAELFPGYLFYFNPVQSDVSVPLRGAFEEGRAPVLALRTLGGAFFQSDPEAGARLCEAGGCADPVELSLRYAWSFPWVRTTIGGTASETHLDRYLEVAAHPRPLDPTTLARVRALVAQG